MVSLWVLWLGWSSARLVHGLDADRGSTARDTRSVGHVLRDDQ